MKEPNFVSLAANNAAQSCFLVNGILLIDSPRNHFQFFSFKIQNKHIFSKEYLRQRSITLSLLIIGLDDAGKKFCL